MLMSLKNFLVQAPWPLVIIGIVILTYFASGKKIKTTSLVYRIEGRDIEGNKFERSGPIYVLP